MARSSIDVCGVRYRGDISDSAFPRRWLDTLRCHHPISVYFDSERSLDREQISHFGLSLRLCGRVWIRNEYKLVIT